MKINPITQNLLWNSNLEFTFFPHTHNVSQKILYRSFWDIWEYRDKIYTQISNQNYSNECMEKIEEIFIVAQEWNLTLHYWEDRATGRTKFYISLYWLSFKKSLIILSRIRKILRLDRYFLEKDFHQFDCLGFDLLENSMTLKVYELLSHKTQYITLLPEYISSENIKEIWVLKTNNRKKIFFRLKTAIKPPESLSIENKLQELKTTLWSLYSLECKMTYYCIEGNKEEIYFI